MEPLESYTVNSITLILEKLLTKQIKRDTACHKSCIIDFLFSCLYQDQETVLAKLKKHYEGMKAFAKLLVKDNIRDLLKQSLIQLSNKYGIILNEALPQQFYSSWNNIEWHNDLEDNLPCEENSCYPISTIFATVNRFPDSSLNGVWIPFSLEEILNENNDSPLTEFYFDLLKYVGVNLRVVGYYEFENTAPLTFLIDKINSLALNVAIEIDPRMFSPILKKNYFSLVLLGAELSFAEERPLNLWTDLDKKELLAIFKDKTKVHFDFQNSFELDKAEKEFFCTLFKDNPQLDVTFHVPRINSFYLLNSYFNSEGLRECLTYKKELIHFSAQNIKEESEPIIKVSESGIFSKLKQSIVNERGNIQACTII